jgi:hypothetical protein
MRVWSSGLAMTMATVLLVVSAQRVHAKCDPTGADASDVAGARKAVADNCPCASATSHGEYVSCASTQAKATLVNQSCHGAVVKCAARSTCGKDGFVTCCRTNAKGVTKCSTKSGADKCKVPRGGSACVGSFASCCDACTSSGCAPSSPSSAFLDLGQ